MKNQSLSSYGRFAFGVCLASLLTVLGSADRAGAQGQGVYITQSAANLTKLVTAANNAGYTLQENSFSVGGGWLKQSNTAWIPLFSVNLKAGKSYRFLAAGDNDARDVDLEVQDAAGNTVAKDGKADPTAVVNYTPASTGKYLVRIRLYASQGNAPCVCLAIVMSK